MAATSQVYVIYHEHEQGRVTYRYIEAIALCKEDAYAYCENYDFYIIVPKIIDQDISNLEEIHIVCEEDDTLYASIMTFKSLHASLDEAENCCRVYCEIKTLRNFGGIFY